MEQKFFIGDIVQVDSPILNGEWEVFQFIPGNNNTYGIKPTSGDSAKDYWYENYLKLVRRNFQIGDIVRHTDPRFAQFGEREILSFQENGTPRNRSARLSGGQHWTLRFLELVRRPEKAPAVAPVPPSTPVVPKQKPPAPPVTGNIRNMTLEQLKKRQGVVALFETGSRVICDPPVQGTDRDICVFLDGQPDWAEPEEETFDQYDGNPMEGFWSIREGHINWICTHSRTFFEAFRLATATAKALNLTNKKDRITLFRAILYKEFPRMVQEVNCPMDKAAGRAVARIGQQKGWEPLL